MNGNSDTSSASMARSQSPPSRAHPIDGWSGLVRTLFCVRWHGKPATNAGLQGFKVTLPGTGSNVCDGLVLRPMAHDLQSDKTMQRQLAGSLVFRGYRGYRFCLQVAPYHLFRDML